MSVSNLGQLVTPIILAGGLGTRLRSAVPDRPKPLALVQGRPFITFILDQLVAAGFQTAVVSTGHLASQFPERLGAQWKGLHLSYVVEHTALGTGGAVRLAAQNVGTPWVLVLNGDSFCECDLSEFIRCAVATKSSASMVLTSVTDVSRYGAVEVSPRGEILSFREKTASTGPGTINAGIYLLNRSELLSLPDKTPFSLERDLFPAWLPRGIAGFRARNSQFIDIGTPESFAAAPGVLCPLSP